MYIAADIGGTKTHVALYKESSGKFTSIKDKIYPSQDHGSIEEILNKFLQGVNDPIDRMCLGIAGPIKEGICKTTNLPWVIDASKLSKELNIPYVYLINDLEANAYGIKVLGESDFFVLNKGVESPGNQALISAGTGLGEAGLFWTGSEHVPFACEGGHVDFAPRDDLEIELLHFLMEKFGSHISYERVLCGNGIFELFDFIVKSKLEEPSREVLELIKTEPPPKVVSSMGSLGKCPACTRALKWFASIYGSECGNTALKFMSLSCVYIGGGIAPKIIDILKGDEFMKGFCDKGRFNSLLSKIPVKIVLNEDTALLGAAFYCYKKT